MDEQVNLVAELETTNSVAKNDPLFKVFGVYENIDDVEDYLFKPRSKFIKLLNDKQKMQMHIRHIFELQNRLKKASLLVLKTIGDINYKDEHGDTFLHYFFKNISIDSYLDENDRLSLASMIVNNLLDRGASVSVLDNNGHSPFDIVLRGWQERYVRLILMKFKKICFCYVSNCEQRHLINASSLHVNSTGLPHFFYIVQYCLDNGFDLTVHTDDNATPIIIMCNVLKYGCRCIHASKMANVVNPLIDKGYDINAVDTSGHTALHYTIKFHDTELTKALIELGADVNHHIDKQYMPLIMARSEHLSCLNVKTN